MAAKATGWLSQPSVETEAAVTSKGQEAGEPNLGEKLKKQTGS